MKSKLKRGQYTLEFKLEAVRLVKTGQSLAVVSATGLNAHCFKIYRCACPAPNKTNLFIPSVYSSLHDYSPP